MMERQFSSISISSPWLSRVWQFKDANGPIAGATRNVAQRTSRINLADGRTWLLTPDGWGTIRLLEGRTRTGDCRTGWPARTNAGSSIATGSPMSS